jgi:hypothetical protein
VERCGTSEDGVVVTTDRKQVLAFRLRRQHLTRRLGAARMADVTASCGVRNSPPGSAQVALLARVNGVSQTTPTCSRATEPR